MSEEPAGDFWRLLTSNPHIEPLLRQVREMEIPDCWLASGCLVQTVWNARHGFAPTFGIKDYDLIYFDPDTSWAKENAMIGRIGGCFKDLNIEIEIRNQARVPLWYRDKFGIDYPTLTEACQSLDYYPSQTSAVAVQLDGEDQPVFRAPFGLSLALDMIVRPNKALPISEVYAAKARQWQSNWPKLRVEAWE
ncbi:nucleotidyltransferase family protein [Emcibacter nanhaiensis]|uniref:Nucleotidyltransferase family protein n=1 Tax=Emcibacter nanhaiensis TaxID=1505037 RepID=A0A501PHI3_9PROT|nr:nucleotidyltransferase family protein [Emcibacter nanhaiensis]TPD59481.1 nucleotidyltransferase family protein [Emcibacter nanhaiensis]